MYTACIQTIILVARKITCAWQEGIRGKDFPVLRRNVERNDNNDDIP